MAVDHLKGALCPMCGLPLTLQDSQARCERCQADPTQPSTVTAEAALSDLIHEVADVLNPLARLIADKGDGIMAKYDLVGDLRKALKQAQAVSAQLKTTPSPVTGALATVIAAARAAAERFRQYERLHAAKPDQIKAKSNADMAAMIEDALAALAAQKAEG